jgi:carbon storage regulator
MLVLTLKKDEKLLIGKDISLTVVQIRGNDVGVGIEAPSDVAVLRDKLVKTQKPENSFT